MTDRVGQRLGNYRLVRKIGQGGFAEVYLGQHIYLETFAAIKVLHARLESDDVEILSDRSAYCCTLIASKYCARTRI